MSSLTSLCCASCFGRCSADGGTSTPAGAHSGTAEGLHWQQLSAIARLTKVSYALRLDEQRVLLAPRTGLEHTKAGAEVADMCCLTQPLQLRPRQLPVQCCMLTESLLLHCIACALHVGCCCCQQAPLGVIVHTCRTGRWREGTAQGSRSAAAVMMIVLRNFPPICKTRER